MTDMEKILEKLEQLQAQNLKMQVQNQQLQEELTELKGQNQKKMKSTPKKEKLAAAPKGKAARAITEAEYFELIDTMRTGGCGFRPSERAATIFVLQANLGLRLGDVLNLRMDSFIRDGGRWRLDIIEQKTGKVRKFSVPPDMIIFIQEYREAHGIGPKELLFPVKIRGVQKYLASVVSYLDLQGNVTSHSFRKFYATQIYKDNKCNIQLVRKLLQHASTETTQKYIGIESEEVETAIQNNLRLR